MTKRKEKQVTRETRNRAVQAVRLAYASLGSDEAVAVKVPTTAATVYRWRTGKMLPSYFVALQVLRVFKELS
jgi:hypothetical protein